jgi:hypothetical protein
MSSAAFLQTLLPERKPMITSPILGVRIQRKCACGSRASSQEDECSECRSKKRLLTKLAIGASNDPLEEEADRVADQELAAHAHPVEKERTVPGGHAERQDSVAARSAPASVDRALAGTACLLEPGLQRDMSQRFGHDFAQVQVHCGHAAEQSAREIGADAYTVGQHVVFGAGQFAPESRSGRRLLAHELAHVVQQSGASELRATGGAAPVLQAQSSKKSTPRKQKPKVAMICGRASRKVPGNSITQINLDVGANTLTIDWVDPKKAPPLSAGTHAISPGAGRCCVDCNDDTVSQTPNSLCTPKGSNWPVDHTGCVLSGHPSAKNPTYFQRGGVAIHSGNVSAPPQSHGCARTTPAISELIHDNVVPRVTQIASSGTWAGTTCYLKQATDHLSNRKDVCDGKKLKSTNKRTKAKGGGQQGGRPGGSEEAPAKQTPKPVAEVPPVRGNEVGTVEDTEMENEGGPEMIGDGPGPNNEPTMDEGLGEMPVADTDVIDETGNEDETVVV